MSYSNVVANHVPALGIVFVFVAVIANFSVFNTYIASGSRGFFALAEDNLAPRSLVKCSKERGVPYIAVLSLGAFSLVVCMFPFEVIVVVDVMLFMAAYVLIFISASILRIKEPDLERPFKVPFRTKGFIAMCVPPISTWAAWHLLVPGVTGHRKAACHTAMSSQTTFPLSGSCLCLSQ